MLHSITQSSAVLQLSFHWELSGDRRHRKSKAVPVWAGWKPWGSWLIPYAFLLSSWSVLKENGRDIIIWSAAWEDRVRISGWAWNGRANVPTDFLLLFHWELCEDRWVWLSEAFLLPFEKWMFYIYWVRSCICMGLGRLKHIACAPRCGRCHGSGLRSLEAAGSPPIQSPFHGGTCSSRRGPPRWRAWRDKGKWGAHQLFGSDVSFSKTCRWLDSWTSQLPSL